MSRIILYYQTFNGLEPILKMSTQKCTHIHVSSIHFGTNNDGSLYIHLNDDPPNSPKFDSMWKQIESMSKKGVKIILMVGGAGGAYYDLFSNFEAYYSMLKCCLYERPYISGIDLDIEEYVELDDVKMLINRIVQDFGSDFIISMAPVQSSLMEDQPGLGGFVYKDLYNSPEGKYIDYFNGQFYSDYSVKSYQRCIQNGYPAPKVVMGMISAMYNKGSKSSITNILQELVKQYPDFGGVFDWEEFDSYPSGKEWIIDMDNTINKDDNEEHELWTMIKLAL